MSNHEEHRFTFEGAVGKLADHLVAEHGVLPGNLESVRDGMTPGHWVALDDIHRAAHAVPVTIARPTADAMYAKAAEALARAASDVHTSITTRLHIEVADGYRALAATLDEAERATRRRGAPHTAKRDVGPVQ